MKYFGIVIFIFSFFTAYSQNYSNLIDNGKYAKVLKKSLKALKKKPNSIEDLYFASVVTSRVLAGKEYAPKQAFDYYIKAKAEYVKEIDDKKLSKLDLISINYTSFRILSDSIYVGGLTNAINTNTEEGFIEFLNYFTEATETYKNRAVIERNRLAFEKSKIINTVSSFQSFIDQYPDAIEVPQAIKERNKLAFSAALTINTVSSFQNFIDKYPAAIEVPQAIKERNKVAYRIAQQINTVEGYRDFIKNYANATEVAEAWKGIHTLSFQEAKSKNTIEGYEEFISKFPKAEQVSEATEKIYLLAFDRAKKSNNSAEMQEFIKKYPKSSQILEARKLFNIFQYNEIVDENNWLTLKFFIESYPNNELVSKAEERLMVIASGSEDAQLFDYLIGNFEVIDSLKSKHYRIYTKDGELNTLKKYQLSYNQNLPNEFYEDFQNAELAEKLLLHLPYNNINYSSYLHYLKEVPDKELSFVAVQRILSPYIATKKFNEAVKVLDGLPIDKNFKKVKNLRNLLSEKLDPTIIPTPLKNLNTIGNEFSPVISADDKTIYFCGQNRNDNIGGEDIFESTSINDNFTIPQINSLSSRSGNEAPVAISSDGTKMILFQSGKLLITEKTSNGWSSIKEIDNEINSGEWQGDAMLSSDGNTIFFASYRQGEVFNVNDMNDKQYHGDNAYPTDIFFCKKDDYGVWSYPVNMGNTINTPYCERFPFLHPDMKTLYFSSDGHGGLGKLDVYMSTRLNDTCWTCWSPPINLGKEINTCETDAGYKISTNGNVALYTVNKRKIQESSVMFVLDVSGSMSGEKIETLKQESKTTIQEVLNNNAEVAIAAFDGVCNYPITNYLDFTKDYRLAESFIDNLIANGGTPMYEAYFEASRFLKLNNKNSEKNKVIVLMTDGDATSCNVLDDVLNQLKNMKSLYKTQTIAYSVSDQSSAYSDLNKIADFSGGELFAANSAQDLGVAFEQANNGIFQIISGPDNKDIYKINLPAHLRPDIVARIEGELKNSKNQPISATIRWEDLESNKVIGTSKSDPQDGSYFIVLPMGKNYGYFVEDSSYFPMAQSLDLRNTTNAVEVKKDIVAISFTDMINEKIAVPMNNLFFEKLKSNLLIASYPELNRIASILKEKKYKVEISGHTDNVGSESMNLKLSEERANSVKNFLFSKGVNPSFIQSIGYGFSKPKTTNETEEGKAENRRVEIRFVSE